MTLPFKLPKAHRLTWPDNGDYSILFSGRDIGFQVRAHETDTFIQGRGNADYVNTPAGFGTTGNQYQRQTLWLYKVKVDAQGATIVDQKPFYYPSSDGGGFGSKYRFVRTPTGYAMLAPMYYYARNTPYGLYDTDANGYSLDGPGVYSNYYYRNGNASGWWLVLFDKDLNRLTIREAVGADIQPGEEGNSNGPNYAQAAEIFCLPDGDIIFAGTRQSSSTGVSAFTFVERYSADLSVRRWQKILPGGNNGYGNWMSTAAVFPSINQLWIQFQVQVTYTYSLSTTNESLIKFNLDDGSYTQHLLNAPEGAIIWEYHALMNHDPEPGMDIPFKGAWSPTDGNNSTWKQRLNVFRDYPLDVDEWPPIPYPPSYGPGIYASTGDEAWYSAIMSGWGMVDDTQVWLRKADHHDPFIYYPTPYTPLITAYLGEGRLTSSGWTDVAEKDFLAMLDPADADIAYNIAHSFFSSIGFFVVATKTAYILSLVNALSSGRSEVQAIWYLPNGEAALRLFQRSDARGIVASPRLGGHTGVGNNPGSLQDNPAPRLPQGGNTYLRSGHGQRAHQLLRRPGAPAVPAHPAELAGAVHRRPHGDRLAGR